ncbi:FimV/HubP family polar landmark protein [Massilia forsythiae]|nr:FimV/HubP family polar landmark protein [Massilia forsythiae]
MHPIRRLPLKSSALKKLTAALASAMVLTSAANAAGLGKLTVLSALGQPLRAEIELTSVSADEAAGLAAKLASPEAFKTANIEFNPALLSLRFNVEQRGGRQFIRVSSTQPLNEPFVDLLLELSWNNGRLVREYTFLLDPAELRATQSAQVARSEAPQRARSDAALAAPAQSADAVAPADTPRSRRAARRAAASADEGGRGGAGEYRVKPGDSLGRIATQLKPVDVSLDMMLVALYRANPEAFVGNNMNRLKSGRILSVPAGEAVRAIGDGEAHGVVVAHAADFNAYRNKLAGQVGASEATRTPPAGQSAAGKISAKVEERPTAANESQDRLRLSKAAPSAPGAKAGTASTEDTIAKQKALEDAQARVKELERNVTDLEKLAEVKSKAGADAQNKAAAAASPAPAIKLDQPAAEQAAQPPARKLAPIKPVVKPATPEPGLLDFIMDNLTYLGAAAAVALLAALAVAQRRKKKPARTVVEPVAAGAPAEPAHSMFAETGGQSVDTNNSVFNSSFAPSASQLDTNEVDPVAEADVYIAYGRDAQAEEILKEALRTHPDRMPVRLKLLEIYAARKDLRAFETQAGEVYGMTRGQGGEWAQAAALGLSIDPHNPLYAGNPVHATGAGLAAGAAAGLAAGASAGAASGFGDGGRHDMLSKDLDDAFGAADADDRAAHEHTYAPGADTTPAAAFADPAALDGGREPLGFDQHFAEAMNRPAAPVPAPEDDNALDFDLGGLAFEPVSANAPAAPPAGGVDDFERFNKPGDVPDLEFDMGAFDAAPAAAAFPAATETAAPAAERPLDFSFDMDLGAAPAPNPVPHYDPLLDDDLFEPVPAPATATAPAAAAAPDTGIDMANLAREFDLPDLPTELSTGVPADPYANPAAPERSAPASELKDPLFDLDAMDFGLEAQRPAAQPAPAPDLAFDVDRDFPAAPAPAPARSDEPVPPLALDDDPFALPALDGLPPATPAPAADAAYAPHDLLEPQNLLEPHSLLEPQREPHLDMPAFDLELPGDAPLPLADVQAVDSAELSPAHMEMETKLDLAVAYQEIGDKEGARELLDEVVKGGSSAQVERANAMRASLG